MKKVILSIGVPGAGKTTWLSDFAKKNSYSYICPDDIRAEVLGDASDQSKNKEIWEEARNRLSRALASGNTVVFDATFASQRDRLNFINYAKDIGAEKVVGIWFDVSLETAKERNAERSRIVPEYAIERMYQNILKDNPSIAEGFDSIFILDDAHELQEVHKHFEGREAPKILKIK